MSTAEAAHDEATHEQGQQTTARSRVPPSSPGLSAGWLLRTAAFAAVLAGVTGLILGPGARGNAGEGVVVWTDRASAFTAYLLVSLLLGLFLWSAFELVRVHGMGLPVRAVLLGGSAAVVAISLLGLRDRLPADWGVVLSAAATVVAMAGAWRSARAPHTRALAGMLLLFAFAAIWRLAAFELAREAGERARVQLYELGRLCASAGVLLEALGQLVAVAWLWTRSRLWGQLGSFAALAGALVLAWGVSQGAHSGAPLWQAVVHTALSESPGLPTPEWKLFEFAVFLVPASLLLALVAALQPRQVPAVAATVALALVSRGAFDAPLRALCVVVAALWASLASADERAMWQTLLEDRKRRLAEEEA